MNTWTKAVLTLLRIAVGWHFLYEGLWKIDSDKGAASYATSWYTLQSSVGRLGCDLEGMDLPPALARADAWYDEVVRAFKARNNPLADDQKARLADLRDKVKLAAAARGEEIVNFDWVYVRDEVLRIATQQEEERFTSLPYLQGSAGPFRPVFRGLVRDIDGFERLTPASAQAAIDDRFRAISKHYRFSAAQQARFSQVRDNLKIALAATLNDAAFRARLDDYRAMRQRVAADARRTTAPFSEERLAADRKKLDVIAGELLALIGEPLVELAVQAQSIATVDQLGAGPVPRPGEPAGSIDRAMEWGLVAIGACLLLGLFTPIAISWLRLTRPLSRQRS